MIRILGLRPSSRFLTIVAYGGGQILPTGGGVPARALTYQGQILTYQGQILTYGGA